MMGFYIYAWLEQGNPRLRVVDAATGRVCLRWDYHGADRPKSSDKKEIQRLFRDLLLLTCRQETHNVRFFNIRPERIGDADYSENDIPHFTAADSRMRFAAATADRRLHAQSVLTYKT
jgi:hypothetical protein